MTSGGLREKLAAIETELSEIDIKEDSAAYMNVMTRLYLLLISDDSIRYFRGIFDKVGIERTQIAKDVEDYLSEVWLKVRTGYIPSKGGLFPFLSAHFRNGILDDARKANGMTGLPRTWEDRRNVTVQSSDQPPSAGDTIIDGVNIIDRDVARRSDSSKENPFDENLVMDAQLYELASQILHFIDNHAGKRIGKNRFLYYRLFYSTDIINFVKMTRNTGVFQHERDAVSAMHFPYINFCTDKQDKYVDSKGLTIRGILERRLAVNEDVLPEDKITDMNRKEHLNIPLLNEVIRGYLMREEKLKVSSPNISQEKKKYMIAMHEGLRKKDLSYADIVML